MKLREALETVGVNGDWKPTRGNIDGVLSDIKRRMVQSEGNHDQRVVLSQAKETFKKLGKSVCACGHRKAKDAPQCPECRLGKNASLNNAVEWVPLPLPKKGKVRYQMERLTEVGQSVLVESACRESIYHAARALKITVETRVEGKGYRVWRTDGKTMEELNQIINLKVAANETSA